MADIKNIYAYVQDGTTSKEELLALGWVDENGHFTDKAQEESKVHFTEVPYLRLGCDIVVQGQTFPKGQLFLLTWRDHTHPNRRKWFEIVMFRSGEEEYRVPISYSPRHEVLFLKLPIDTKTEA